MDLICEVAHEVRYSPINTPPWINFTMDKKHRISLAAARLVVLIKPKHALLSAFAMLCVLFGQSAKADTASDVRVLYQQFVAAQNAGDLGTVRSLLSDTADFLWVTDGMAVWGRDATIERMSLFQKSEIWRVEPGLDKSRIVELGSDVAIFHLPLVLVIGSSSPGPSRLRFLVEVVCHKTTAGWRIAALLTTTEKAQ
jgi:ketosteroid isomerase-like protein